MSTERHLHIADEYDQIAETVLAEASLAAEKSLNVPFPSTDPFEKSRIFSEKEFFTDLIEVGDDPEALELFNNKYDNAQIVNRPVLKSSLAEPKWGEQLPDDSETLIADTPALDFRKEIRSMLLVPEGEDSVEFFKALPWNTWLEMKRAGYFTREAFESIGQQVDLDPKTIVRAAAVAVTAAGVIAAGVSNSGPGRTEQAMGPDGVIDTELIVSRSKDKASVPFSSDNQKNEESEKAAESLLGVPASDVVIEGDKIEFTGQAIKASDERLIAATMEAQRPDVATPEITPEPKVQITKSPEQMNDSEFMTYLATEAKPTVEEYERFDVDTSRVGVFDDELPNEKIQPKAFVGHWTAGLYENGVDQFVDVIKSREGKCCSVMYFMDQSGKVFRFTDKNQKTYHAAGANDFSQGVEIEARGLRDYTPEQMRNFIYLTKRFLDASDIPVTREAFLGHQEVFDKWGKEVNPKNVKTDMPTSWSDLLINYDSVFGVVFQTRLME
jgi:hypothetical protein